SRASRTQTDGSSSQWRRRRLQETGCEEKSQEARQKSGEEEACQESSEESQKTGKEKGRKEGKKEGQKRPPLSFIRTSCKRPSPLQRKAATRNGRGFSSCSM